MTPNVVCEVPTIMSWLYSQYPPKPSHIFVNTCPSLFAVDMSFVVAVFYRCHPRGSKVTARFYFILFYFSVVGNTCQCLYYIITFCCIRGHPLNIPHLVLWQSNKEQRTSCVRVQDGSTSTHKWSIRPSSGDCPGVAQDGTNSNWVWRKIDDVQVGRAQSRPTRIPR